MTDYATIVQKKWQEEYGDKYKLLFIRPDLASDFYAKQERAWLFVSEHLDRILGYALSRYNLSAEERKTLHINCIEDVLIALYETRHKSSDHFAKEALRLCANFTARAYYHQKKEWYITARNIEYDEIADEVTEPDWDAIPYHQLFDVAWQLQERNQLQNQRARRLLTQIDIENSGLAEIKLFVLYLLVVLLKLANASRAETRALLGTFLLGDNDAVTSQKIYQRTKHTIEQGNIRKARSKGLGKLRKLMQGYTL